MLSTKRSCKVAIGLLLAFFLMQTSENKLFNHLASMGQSILQMPISVLQTVQKSVDVPVQAFKIVQPTLNVPINVLKGKNSLHQDVEKAAKQILKLPKSALQMQKSGIDMQSKFLKQFPTAVLNVPINVLDDLISQDKKVQVHRGDKQCSKKNPIVVKYKGNNQLRHNYYQRV